MKIAQCVGAKAQHEKNALKHYKKKQTNKQTMGVIFTKRNSRF